MEAPPHLPPINYSPLQPFHEPPIQPPFMAQPNNSHNANTGQNYDRDGNDIDVIPPPPPPPPPGPESLPEIQIPAVPPFAPSMLEQAHPPPPTLPQDASEVPHPMPPPPVDNEHTDEDRSGSHSDDGSGGDDSGSDDEQEQEHDSGDGFVWQPLIEDKSLPCEDELHYIAGRNEHSALDYKYWEKKAFFNVDDPEIVPGASGRIDWLVEKFNGTKEDPNKEVLMRSGVVRVGDYDWRVKLFPRGNDTDYVSVYIENVTMQSDGFEGMQDFVNPPLPFLTGMDKPKKRRSVAAQVAVVMYNPDEPRVYEYHYDAHQFTKDSADYGWTRFTRHSRRDFVYRQHGQRQAILRNDKLAFTAYIRIVHDPTGCMWSHGGLNGRFDDSIALTGLRPFSPQMSLFAAQLPLLHFAPFRKFLMQCKDTRIVFWFQTLLWKCMSRKKSDCYGSPDNCADGDTVAWLRYAIKSLKKEVDPATIENLVGSLDPENGAAVCGNRLKTAKVKSVQQAVDAHPTTLEKPALLTLELERQEFQREKRKWRKLTNKVNMEDRIVVGGTSYTLFSFATHCGDLQSNRFNVYIRPHGTNTTWYQYTDGEVKCLTRKQCVDRLAGIDPPGDSENQRHHSSHSRSDPFRLRHLMDDHIEVAHVVSYIRDDFTQPAFTPSLSESWDVPDDVKKGHAPVSDGFPHPSVVDGPSTTTQDVDPAPLTPQDAGYATPNVWAMDGDDVIMSDTSTANHPNTAPDPPPSVTIDHLGREYYHGPLHNHLYHGHGHQITMSGDEYTGAFASGQRSGEGTCIYASTGNTYTGSWSQNLHHGNGVLTESSTGNVFSGGWKEGRKHGKFTLTGTVTEEDKGWCSICFDKEISTAFYDCGHVVACWECAGRVENCPVCRRRVVARLELFGVRIRVE